MAIIDKREIAFDARALVSAIAAALSKESIGLPTQLPTGVRFFPDQGFIQVLYSENETRRVDAERLGAFLVSYCVRTRIPIPRRVDKEVRIEAASVIVAFKTYYAQVPIPNAAREESGAILRPSYLPAHQ
jgi:hypothetical protein